jgi:hypothetical protein
MPQKQSLDFVALKAALVLKGRDLLNIRSIAEYFPGYLFGMNSGAKQSQVRPTQTFRHL